MTTNHQFCWVFFYAWICSQIIGLSAMDFSYDDNELRGPSRWKVFFPECGGFRQSPVAIDSFFSPPVSFKPFRFFNYDKSPNNASVLNNGDTAMVKLGLPYHPQSVEGGGLNGEYQFMQVHIHWGRANDRGSEHVLDGKRYAGEFHFVHWKKAYGDEVNALNYKDGYAVLSFMVDVSPIHNIYWEPIISSLPAIEREGEEVPFRMRYTLFDLLPSDLTHFYRYHGSLTTPTCDQVVVWTVFQHPIHISASQLDDFRRLYNADGELIADNFRPLQPLNDRVVFKNIQSHSEHYQKKTYHQGFTPRNYAFFNYIY